METISVHNRIFSAVGYDDDGKKYSGSADVDMSDEIQEITDIELVVFFEKGKYYYCLESLLIPEKGFFKKLNYYKCERDNILIDEREFPVLITEEFAKKFDTKPVSVSWQQLKDFIDSIPTELLQNTAYIRFSDLSHGRPCLEPGFTEEDIFVNIHDDEESGTLAELKMLHDDLFDINDYRPGTPKGTPFLWAE